MLTRFNRPNHKNSFFLLSTGDETFNNDFLSEGVHFVEYKEDKEGNVKTFVSIISTVVYIEEKLNSESQNFYKVVMFDDDKEKYNYFEPKDLFNITSNKNRAWDWLINNGLVIYGKKTLLLEYLQISESEAKKKPATEKNGWQLIDDDWEYIARGISTTEKITYVGSSIAQFKSKGDKEEYREFLKGIFVQHPIVFGITAYLNAGFINRFVKEDNNQLLAITGISSAGKSTGAKIGYSFWTDPTEFLSMNATQYGVNHALKSYNDNGIFFDETGEKTIDDRNIKGFLYSLASGKSRLKMSKNNLTGNYGIDDVPDRLFYSLLICGEVSIINGLKVEEGVSTRLCELVLNKYVKIFNFPEDEDIHTRQQQVEEYNKFILSNYGVLSGELIELIKSETHLIEERYQYYLDIFRKESNFQSSLANRKLKIMAYISTSAEFIARVVYKDEPEAINEIVYDMQEAIQQALFNNIADLDEAKDHYKTALNNFEDTLAGYFIIKKGGEEIPLENYTVRPKEVWGEIDIDWKYENSPLSKGVKHILINNDRLNSVCEKLELDSKLFIAYLKDNGLLEMQDGKSTKVVKRQGQAKRYYSIRVDMKFFEVVQTVQMKDGEIDFENPYIKP